MVAHYRCRMRPSRFVYRKNRQIFPSLSLADTAEATGRFLSTRGQWYVFPDIGHDITPSTSSLSGWTIRKEGNSAPIALPPARSAPFFFLDAETGPVVPMQRGDRMVAALRRVSSLPRLRASKPTGRDFPISFPVRRPTALPRTEPAPARGTVRTHDRQYRFLPVRIRNPVAPGAPSNAPRASRPPGGGCYVSGLPVRRPHPGSIDPPRPCHARSGNETADGGLRADQGRRRPEIPATGGSPPPPEGSTGGGVGRRSEGRPGRS